MKKRIISMLLAVCLLGTMLPTVAFATDEIASGTCGENVTWVLDDEGTMTISGTGDMTDYGSKENRPVWLQEEYDIVKLVVESGVTGIGVWAFNSVETLTEVILPDTITSIDASSFTYCTNLKQINFPEGITSIGDYAFSNCQTLTDVVLPSTLTELGAGAFEHCKAITTLSVPGSAAIANDYVFYGLTALTDLTLEDGITAIGYGCFGDCESLTSVVFPATVTRISSDSFGWCSALTEVTFVGDAPSIGETAFYEVTATVRYPAGNETWTADVLQDYGGALTWVADCSGGCTYESVVTEPTCTEGGYTTHTCTVCGDSYTDSETAAVGHSYIESETVDPTCTEGGYTTHTCTACGDSYTDAETAAPGHSFVDGTCTRCGEVEFTLVAPTVKVSIIKKSGKIKLTWNAVEGAAGYNVYYSTDDGKNYNLLKKVSGTSLNHTSAKAGKTYYYYVVALDEAGYESEASDTVNLKCKLAQPSITLSNVASTGKIRIEWEEVPGATRYEVYMSKDGGGHYEHLYNYRSTKCTHTTAEAGLKYRYKIKAFGENEDGESTSSEFSAAKDRTCDLAQPKIKLSANSAGKNKIAWKHIDGAVKYEVWCSTDGGETFKKLSTTYNNYIVNTSSEVGKTYHYKVRAIAENSNANSAYSSVKSRTVQKAGPEVSISLTTDGKPRLTWKAVSGATKYKVYVSTDDGYSFTHLKTTTNTKLTHTSAGSGTIYHYVVKAVIGEETRTSAVVFVPCVYFDISNSKSAKSVVTRINEYREEYDIPTLKWYATGLNAARIRVTEIGEGYDRSSERHEELMETYNCYLEMNFKFDGTAEELVDTIMYNYEDYASYFMYEGFEYAVAARNGIYWTIMFG